MKNSKKERFQKTSFLWSPLWRIKKKIAKKTPRRKNFVSYLHGGTFPLCLRDFVAKTFNIFDPTPSRKEKFYFLLTLKTESPWFKILAGLIFYWQKSVFA
jgi:hypothetical protein